MNCVPQSVTTQDLHPEKGPQVRALIHLAAAAAAVVPVAAAAQSSTDVVVMRRAIAPPQAKAVQTVPLTPGARRRCDMPVRGVTVTTSAAGTIGITFSDTAPSLAKAHAICETTQYNVSVCTVQQYGGKSSSTFIVKGFSPGGLGPDPNVYEEFVGAGKCAPL